MSKKPVMLMILDGWGIAPDSAANAATRAKTPNLTKILKEYPHTTLSCSGEEVGLPEGQMGNSEVGHLNIGSGRIVYQELTRITKAVKDGTFYKNKELNKIMDTIKENNSALHLMGLVSPGGVHSYSDHLYALIKMAKEKRLSKVFIHAFLDGRDVPPKTATKYLNDLEEKIKEIGVGKIATVSGRYYAMDRDKRWDRVEKAYEAISKGHGLVKDSALIGIEESYKNNITDEFVVPFCVKGVNASVNDGDGIIFFNFRPDRARQLTRAFVDKNFPYFERSHNPSKISFLCMTQYDITIDAPIAFKPEKLINTYGEVISKKGLKQLRIAETEKYAHITFFFNGGVEQPNEGEDRILVPSPKVATYDLQPEMSAYLVTDKLLEALDEDKYDTIILNFANPDMVGHTGIFSAAIKAMETIDDCVGKIVTKILSKQGTICITADHGNIECMEDTKNHTPYTAHTTNKVYFIVVGDEKKRSLHEGILADIAPTLLDLLGLVKPAEMTGKSLLNEN